MTQISRKTLLLILIVFFSSFNVTAVLFSGFSWSSRSEASDMLIQTVGYVGPAISSECTATRNPVLESVCACLGDLPGGYCYHLSCGIVAVPVMEERPDQIQVSGPR
jgi:hypothetical protein